MSPACRPEPHLTCESEGAEKLQESQSTLTARAQRPPAPRSGSHSHPEPPRTRSADPEKDKVRAAGNNAGPTRTDARGTGKRGTQASQATGRGTEAPGRHPSGQTEAENAELLSCFSTQAGGRVAGKCDRPHRRLGDSGERAPRGLCEQPAEMARPG